MVTPSATSWATRRSITRLVQLEVRDTVAQQTTDPIVLFEQGHFMADTGQLLGSGQACRACTHHSHFLATFGGSRLRLDPTILPRHGQ
jgi:hypothetical protein